MVKETEIENRERVVINRRRELDDVVQVGDASAAIWRRLPEYSLYEAHARHETLENFPAPLYHKLGNGGLDQDQERHDQYGTMHLHLTEYTSELIKGEMVRVLS